MQRNDTIYRVESVQMVNNHDIRSLTFECCNIALVIFLHVATMSCAYNSAAAKKLKKKKRKRKK